MKIKLLITSLIFIILFFLPSILYTNVNILLKYDLLSIKENLIDKIENNTFLGNYFYKKSQYEDALDQYLQEKCIGDKCDKYFHNLGNAYYKNAINITGDNVFKIELLEKSLESYELSLKIKQNKQTQENRDFVADLLDSLQQPQPEEQEELEDEEEENQEDGEENQEDDENSDDEEEQNPGNNKKMKNMRLYSS